MSSLITTALQVDPPVSLDANYRFNATDRRYIDDQIRGIEQHLVDALIVGRHGSWFDLSGSSAAVVAGDTVCLAGLSSGVVTKAVAAALANAPAAVGVVVTGGSAGGKIFVAFGGVLPPSITGLGTTSGHVRINTTTARLERVAALSSSDYGVGTVDSAGWLQIGGVLVLGLTSTSTLAGDGSNFSNITGSAGIKYTPNANIADLDAPINTQTTNATVTDLFTKTTANSRTYSVRGIVACHNSAVSVYGEWEINAFVTRTSGGTTTVQTPTPVTEKFNTGSLVLTLDQSGGTIRVRGTGIAATTIRWTGRIYVHESI